MVALPRNGLSYVTLCWCTVLLFLSKSGQEHLEVSKLERQEYQMCASGFSWVTNKLSELLLHMRTLGTSISGDTSTSDVFFSVSLCFWLWSGRTIRLLVTFSYCFHAYSACSNPTQVWVVWSPNFVMVLHFHVQKRGLYFPSRSSSSWAITATVLCFWRQPLQFAQKSILASSL